MLPQTKPRTAQELAADLRTWRKYGIEFLLLILILLSLSFYFSNIGTISTKLCAIGCCSLGFLIISGVGLNWVNEKISIMETRAKKSHSATPLAK
jgi:hypothetical protein